MFVLGILQLVPNFFGGVLAHKRGATSRELRETSDVLRILEVRTAFHRFLFNLRSEFFLTFDHGLDAVVHVLNKINFRPAESALVGDVVDMVVRLSMLAMSSSNLYVELVSNCFELVFLQAKIGEVDVDRSSQGGAEVCGARGDVTKVVIV